MCYISLGVDDLSHGILLPGKPSARMEPIFPKGGSKDERSDHSGLRRISCKADSGFLQKKRPVSLRPNTTARSPTGGRATFKYYNRLVAQRCMLYKLFRLEYSLEISLNIEIHSFANGVPLCI